MAPPIDPAAPPLPICRVPSEIKVPPLYVLAAVNIAVPAPSLVSVPVVVPMMLLIVIFPAPPSVRPNVGPVIVPVLVSVSVPESELMRDAAPRVSNPP